PNWWSTIYAFIGAIFSAIVFAAIAVALSPLGMPALTAPFVLTTWVFLVPTADFRALQRVSVAERASTKSLVALPTPKSTRAEQVAQVRRLGQGLVALSETPTVSMRCRNHTEPRARSAPS